MDAQLNDQVTALFRAAGFKDITRMVGDTFLTISGVQGATRAVFHASTAATVGGTGQGGPNKDAPAIEAAVVPSYPDMRQALLDNPDMAKALGLSDEKLEIIRRIPSGT
jgi:hypothetical protein